MLYIKFQFNQINAKSARIANEADIHLSLEVVNILVSSYIYCVKISVIAHHTK